MDGGIVTLDGWDFKESVIPGHNGKLIMELKSSGLSQKFLATPEALKKLADKIYQVADGISEKSST